MPTSRFRFRYQIRVRWGECDAQGIAFNAVYLNFLEVAMAEYFRNLGVRLYDAEQRKVFDIATVKSTIEFKSPVRIDDLIDVWLRADHVGNSSISIVGEIHRANCDELLTSSEVIYVNYDAELSRPRPIPRDLKKLILDYEEGEFNRST